MADAFYAGQKDYIDVLNTMNDTFVAADASNLTGTSTSSLLIEVASKSFTTQIEKSFSLGDWLLIVSDANTANYFHGQVSSYSATTLVVNVDNIGGSGTFADWTITISGTRGAFGTDLDWTIDQGANNIHSGNYIDWSADQGATNIHSGNYTDNDTIYTHPNHSGDVTSTGDGATVITNSAVTLAKMADIATDSFLGRDTAATGVPEVLSVAAVKTLLSLTGTNSGDQDIDDLTPTTTKGDIIVENGVNAIRVGVGANDTVLTADSSEASGVKWADTFVVVSSVYIIPTDVVPTGYLKCNGSAVSRTSYADLFAALGTLYGIGDGSTTFNVPDLRGEFVRGWDDARGVDSGRGVGTSQTDDYKNHTHTAGGRTDASYPVGVNTKLLLDPSSSYDNTTLYTGGSGSGTETRPRNIAMMFVIKY